MRGQASHLLLALIHRRQRRPAQRAQGNVIEAHQRKLGWHRKAQTMGRVQRADRGQVVIAEDGRRAAVRGQGHEVAQSLLARGWRAIPGQEQGLVHFEIVRGQGGPIAGQPFARRGRFDGAADDGNPTVSQLEQVIYGQRGAVRIIAGDRIDARAALRAVDKYDGEGCAAEQRQGKLSAARGDQDEAIHTLPDHGLHSGQLARRVAAGAGQNDREVLRPRGRFDAADHLAGVGIGQAGDDHAQGAALLHGQAARNRAGDIAHFLRQPFDARARLGGDTRVPRQRPRHRGMTDPGGLGHIFDRNAHNGKPTLLLRIRKRKGAAFAYTLRKRVR